MEAHTIETSATPSITTSATSPAGFWLRFVAHMLDNLILSVATTPMSFVGMFLMTKMTGVTFDPNNSDPEVALRMVGLMALFLMPLNLAITGIYNGLFNRSKGGTPGKLMLGLRVVDSNSGEYIGFWHSIARMFAALISALPLYFGYFMVGFRQDKRALHDLLANTRVVKLNRSS